MRKLRSVFCIFTSIALLLISHAPALAANAPETILISSKAFAHNEDMPLRYSASSAGTHSG
jgi:hypothetical protein